MFRDIKALSSSTFDLVVIGGGINGAATAREAALRGLSVALVDAGDFANGTSSRSSKLIHGGLRYLEQRDFKLVRESRLERRLLLKLAPHLARPLPFLLPIYQEDPYNRFKIGLGLSIYDLLGNLGASDRHRMLSPAETLASIPRLRREGLRAGAVYYDSETDDARLCIENILDVSLHGGVTANYVSVERFSTAKESGQPRLVSAEARDQISGQTFEISGRFWVNATGPWVDRLRALVPGYDGTRTIRLTKGTHVVLPAVSDRYALFSAILPGDRIFVMMPWQGFSLLGTTDTDFEGDPASVQPNAGEVDYLLSAVNRILSEPVKAEDVIGAFAGLRSLAMQPGRSPSANTREYRFHEDAWARNMVTVCGGKLTTARALGEKLADVVVERFKGGASSFQGNRANGFPGAIINGHPSRQIPLPGGHTGPWEAYLEAARQEAAREFKIPPEAAERIVRTYGGRWRNVLAPIRQRPELGEVLPGVPALLAAEVAFSIQEEMAAGIDDFLLRRSGLNWAACNVHEAVPAVARIFAEQLAWSPELRESAALKFLSVAAELRFKSAKSALAAQVSFPSPSLA
jgi:glycerol-3-phosphate dehydrogenase